MEFAEEKGCLLISENGFLLLSIPKQKRERDLLEYYSEDVDKSLSNKICQCQPGEIPRGLQYFSEYESGIFSNANWIDIKKDSDDVGVEISLTFDWESWDKPITLQEFLELYQSEMIDLGFDTRIVKEEGWASLNIIFFLNEGPLIRGIDSSIKKSKVVYEELLVRVSKNKAKDILVKVFEFPDGYESICAQYIIWFGEFLGSLGIKAEVSAESRGGQTAIIVSPRDAPDLLEDLERLFYRYLSLPYVEHLPASDVSMSVEDHAKIQLLTSHVENFKLQIQMKETMIQMKDISISSLQEDIKSKNEELMLLKSMKSKTDIEMLDGAVSIGEIKWGVLKINLKKLFDRIR